MSVHAVSYSIYMYGAEPIILIEVYQVMPFEPQLAS